MAGKKPVAERVRAFVAAVLAERSGDEYGHIDDIERDMEALADAVADEFAAQVLLQPGKPAWRPPVCPHCGQPGRHVGDRERDILTTRGSARLVEPKCYCPACRRHFFPSVAGTRPDA